MKTLIKWSHFTQKKIGKGSTFWTTFNLHYVDWK